MRLLEIAAADFGRRDMCCDGENRHARAVTIEQPVDEVQITRSAASCADRERPGQVCFGARCECRDFLVADMQPLDLALPAKGVGQSIQAVPDDAIDAFDAGNGEDFGELFGNSGHGFTPWELIGFGRNGDDDPTAEPAVAILQKSRGLASTTVFRLSFSAQLGEVTCRRRITPIDARMQAIGHAKSGHGSAAWRLAS